MLENQDIFKRYLQEDEQILWSLRPFSRKYPIIDDPKIRHIFSIILAIILVFILHFLFSKIPLDWRKGIAHIIMGSLAFCAAIQTFFFILLVFGGIERQFLQNTEYFISNKQVFSIKYKKNFFMKSKEIVNLPLYGIEYIFTKLRKNKPKPVYDIYFKIKFDTLEEWKDTILICKEMKDYKLKEKYPVLIRRNEGWIEPDLEAIVRLKYVYDIEKFKAIFNDKLGIKIQEPPIDWKRKWLGGDFHNPY